MTDSLMSLRLCVFSLYVDLTGFRKGHRSVRYFSGSPKGVRHTLDLVEDLYGLTNPNGFWWSLSNRKLWHGGERPIRKILPCLTKNVFISWILVGCRSTVESFVLWGRVICVHRLRWFVNDLVTALSFAYTRGALNRCPYPSKSSSLVDPDNNTISCFLTMSDRPPRGLGFLYFRIVSLLVCPISLEVDF